MLFLFIFRLGRQSQSPPSSTRASDSPTSAGSPEATPDPAFKPLQQHSEPSGRYSPFIKEFVTRVPLSSSVPDSSVGSPRTSVKRTVSAGSVEVSINENGAETKTDNGN